MEDNYFDKKLKGILESPPEFRPDPAAVRDMQRQLRGERKPGRNRGLFSLLCLLLLLPLLGLGFFYKKYLDLHHNFTELSQQVSQINTISTIDTIIQKQIIYQIDTVYNIIYKERYIKSAPPRLENYWTLNEQRTWPENSYLYTRQTSLSRVNKHWGLDGNNSALLARNPDSGFFEKDLWSDNEKKENEIVFSALEPLELLLTEIPTSGFFKNIELENKLKEVLPERKINPAYYFVPTGFSVGINASPVVIPVDAYNSQGFSLGLTAAIQLPGNRSLEIGANFLENSFKLKEEAQFADFPIVDPENPSDVLHELKGRFRYLEIPIMIRQKFLANKRLKPMFSAGFVAYRPLQTRFVYEYINGLGEYKLNSTFNDGVFSVDNLKVGLGAEYLLGKKVSAAVELQYQHGFSLNASEYYQLRYFAFNLGLNYEL